MPHPMARLEDRLQEQWEIQRCSEMAHPMVRLDGGQTAGVVGNLRLAGAALEAGWQRLRDLTWHQVLTVRQPDSALKINRGEPLTEGLMFVCLEPVCFNMQTQHNMPLHILLWGKVRMIVWVQAVRNQPGTHHPSQGMGQLGGTGVAMGIRPILGDGLRLGQDGSPWVRVGIRPGEGNWGQIQPRTARFGSGHVLLRARGWRMP